MASYLLIAWLAFDLAIFLIMWFEYAYYKHNLPGKCKKFIEAFTEEEEEEEETDEVETDKAE